MSLDNKSYFCISCNWSASAACKMSMILSSCKALRMCLINKFSVNSNLCKWNRLSHIHVPFPVRKHRVSVYKMAYLQILWPMSDLIVNLFDQKRCKDEWNSRKEEHLIQHMPSKSHSTQRECNDFEWHNFK